MINIILNEAILCIQFNINHVFILVLKVTTSLGFYIYGLSDLAL